MCAIKVVLFICATIIACYGSYDNIVEVYFHDAEVIEIDTIWENHKAAVEDAIGQALQNSIGVAGMNVLVKSPADKQKLAIGYWHNDNQVQLVLQDLVLDDIPRFRLPKVSIELGLNVIKIVSRMSKMIITADYMLLRKMAHIANSVQIQNANVTSPFLFQQVATKGQLTITADNCMLRGHAVASLSGTSVNTGYHYLKLTECQYTIEIYQPGSGTAPVFASYYPINGGLTLEHLLLKPIYDEFMPKLQSAVFSTMNTTAIFEELLPRFRSLQNDIFRNISVYMTTLIRNFNNLIRKKTGGLIKIRDIPQLVWDEENFHTDYEKENSRPLFNKLVLSGLDTAYIANMGGPFQINSSAMIGDQIRFSTIQVRGNYGSNTNNFAVEIRDVAVDIEISAGDPIKLQTLEVNNFGSIAFIPKYGGDEIDVKAWLEPVVLGFIQNKFPEVMLREMRPVLQEALRNTVLGESKGPAGKYGSLNSDVPMVTVRYKTNKDGANKNELKDPVKNMSIAGSKLPKSRITGPRRIKNFRDFIRPRI